MGLISKEIQKFSQEQIALLERVETIAITIDGKSLILSLEDVEITSQDIEGWLVANAGNITVALDITISETLRKEGIARELVNRIQNLRKDSGFEVTDKIIVYLQNDGYVEEAIKNNEQYIKDETLTKELVLQDRVENGTEIVFDEVKTKILISK
jgi:isoleucyl-tRNA synthetase